MFKKLLIISICTTIGIFFSSLLLSQDDPSTTEPEETENVTDESKKEMTEETKPAEPTTIETEMKEQTALAATAKAYSDGKTTFVNSKVQFKVTASDDFALDKIEYKVDEGAPVVFENPFTIDTEGPHVIKYYGIDKVGNKEPEKAYRVVVDNTGPVIVVTTSDPVKKVGDKIYFTKNILFSVTVNDALSGVDKVEYSTDGATYQEYAAAFAMPTTGEVNLKVRSVDNVDNTTEMFAFRVLDDAGNMVEMKNAAAILMADETPPTVEIKPDKELQQINSQNVASTDVKYTILANDDGSGVAATYYRIDGKGEFIPYVSEIQFLNNGKHQIDARSVDKIGNMSTIKTFTVYVDILPPKSDIETVK